MSIGTATAGDVRDIEARLGIKGRRVFTVSGWNDSLRKAGIAAGDFWIATLGVLRWNAGYAQRVLGYRPRSAAKRARMAKGEPPYFASGQFQDGYANRARTVAKATKGHVSFAVLVPGGFLNFHPEHIKSFRRIPPAEAAAVAREFRRALIQAVQTGRAAHASKQQARAAAKAAKKQATAARRAQAQANRSQRRQRATRRAA